MKKRKILSMLLAAAMVLSLLPVSALAEEPAFTDVEGHWGESAIERWSDYGVVSGKGGGIFDPDANMTRAEMAQMYVNLLNLTEKADISNFTDVPADAWYADAVAKCVAAGILNGTSGTTISPNGTVTREQMFVTFGRAMRLTPVESTDSQLSDLDDVSDWAEGMVNALLEAGYISGMGDNTLQPGADINRASVMALLDKSVAVYANESGATVTGNGDNGLVLVVADDVTITGTVGDVIVAQGAAEGTVTLENATVTGTVTVNAPAARVSVAGETTVENLVVAEDAQGAQVSVEKDAAVASVSTAAEDTTLAVSGKVENVTTSGANTTVSGSGTVNKVEAAEGSTGATVTTPGTTVENNGFGSVTTDKGEVKPGETGTTAPSGGSSSGGSTGGGSSVDYVGQAKTALKNAVKNADQYEYDPAYTYSGDYAVAENGDTLTLNGTYSLTEGVDGTAMNDMARFLGALYRADNGATVKAIVYGGETYTWANGENATNTGSNWVKNADEPANDGNTLVSQIVDDYQTDGTIGDLTLNGNYNASITLKLALDVVVTNEGELRTALNAKMPTIKLGNDFAVSQKITVDYEVTIDGDNKTITAADGWNGTQSGNKHLLGIEGENANGVTIRNITFDSSSKAYGIQSYCVTGTTLENVTTKGSLGAGLTVNGSTVTATGLHTSGNAWGGVNVDKGSGVTETTTFTFDATSAFGEGLAVYSDAGDVTVTCPPDAGWIHLTNAYGKSDIWAKVFDGGDGTETSPYEIATAEQLNSIVSGSDSEHLVYYRVVERIDLKDVADNGIGLVQNIVFDGNNTEFSSSQDGTSLYGLFKEVRGTVTIRNLTYDLTNCDSTPWAADVAPLIYQASGSDADILIENVTIKGTHTVDSNNGPFVMNEFLGANSTLTLKDCEMAASLSGDGYNACFIGWQTNTSGAHIVLDSCKVSGELTCPRASIVTANGSNAAKRTYEYKGTNVLSGTVRGTSVAKYFTAVSETDKTSFESEAEAAFTEEDAGALFVGQDDANLAISIGEDGRLIVTASSNSEVTSYEVKIGLYTHYYTESGIESGTWKYFAAQTVTDLSDLSMYNYMFIDANYSGLGEITTDTAGNKIATLNGTTYYVVEDYKYSDIDGMLQGYVGSPSNPGMASATIIQVTAYVGDAMYSSATLK